MPVAAQTNRRRSERKAVNKPISLLVDSDHSEIANSAFAIDLSELGLRIRSDINLVPGQIVTVIPREGSKQAVRSQVIWVGESGSERAGEAGIAFLQPMAPEA